MVLILKFGDSKVSFQIKKFTNIIKWLIRQHAAWQDHLEIQDTNIAKKCIWRKAYSH